MDKEFMQGRYDVRVRQSNDHFVDVFIEHAGTFVGRFTTRVEQARDGGVLHALVSDSIAQYEFCTAKGVW